MNPTTHKADLVGVLHNEAHQQQITAF
jgi:hypothetical protein